MISMTPHSCSELLLGEWLLDLRLVGKKLDVRIMGTTQTSFHKGRYENHCGFINLKEVPANVYSSTTMRIGVSETRQLFCIGYLYPQTTTDRPPFVVGNTVGPITSKIGQRVVIIGPDIQNNPELIGNYGHVIVSGYDLPIGLAFMQVSSPGNFHGKWGYFNEKSVCRSHQELEVIPTGGQA
jgi:hypothetical protein